MRSLYNYSSFSLRAFGDNVVCLDCGDNRLAYARVYRIYDNNNIYGIIKITQQVHHYYLKVYPLSMTQL